MNGHTLELFIDELVLTGVAPNDADAFKASLERELGALVARADTGLSTERGVEAPKATIAQLSGALSEPLPPTLGAAEARRVANAVHGALTRGGALR